MTQTEGENEKLSPHFRLREFLHNGKMDGVTPEILKNLQKLALALEIVRKECGGHPIHINSGFRTPQHNREVGGESNSFHLRGMAADIVVEGQDPKETQRLLADWHGGLGCYKTFSHFDIRGYRARWHG